MSGPSFGCCYAAADTPRCIRRLTRNRGRSHSRDMPNSSERRTMRLTAGNDRTFKTVRPNEEPGTAPAQVKGFVIPTASCKTRPMKRSAQVCGH
jgi:hypothetical protein